MENLQVFKTRFIEECKNRLKKNKKIELYFEPKFDYNPDDVLEHRELKVDEMPKLKLPDNRNNYKAENAIALHRALSFLDATQASDIRLWTFLAHITYWDYMQKRYPIQKQPKEKQGKYILSHWFIDSLNANNLARYNGISSLWWGAYRTYDKNRKDPYELTRELFLMLDYTTHLLSGTQGRDKDFFHAVLDFVIQKKQLFEKFKEAKVRYIMRTVNRMGGYKIFAGLTQKQIITELCKMENGIKVIKSSGA